MAHKGSTETNRFCRPDPISGDRGTPNPNMDERDEGEFLSNDEEEEVVPSDQIACFFNGEDYQVLDLKGLPPGEQSQELDTHLSNKTWGSREFLPNPPKSEVIT